MRLPNNTNKQRRLPLAPGDTKVRPATILDNVPRGTKKQRLKKAFRNDNGGPWFLAESKSTVAQLERRFQGGAVGAVLYERIGAMLKGPYDYIYVQIDLVKDVIDGYDADREPVWKRIKSYDDDERWPEWAVEVCLREIGVELIEFVPDIREVLKSGQY